MNVLSLGNTSKSPKKPAGPVKKKGGAKGDTAGGAKKQPDKVKSPLA